MYITNNPGEKKLVCNEEKVYKYFVKEVKSIIPSIFSIKLFPQAENLNYTHGHYCKLLCKDGKYRSFSIVSSPNTQGMIELHIRITEYSIPIFKNILIKDNVVGLKGPFGTCTNIQELVFPTILLAEGLGLASFFSALNDLKVPTNNLLIIWLRHAEDHDYASPQIALWEKEIKNVSFVVIEKPNNNYTKIKSYCDNFVAKNKKICLCIAGSKKVRDFMIDNCIARNSKNYIKLLYDI